MKQTVMLTCMLSCMVVLGACNSRSQNKPAAVRMVKTVQVKTTAGMQSLSYPGKVVSGSEVNLSFRIAGPLAGLPVHAGQYVRKGQLLALIDPRDYQLQLDATEAEYQRIKAEAERVMELYARGSATKNDYDKALYGLRQISAKYHAHKHSLEDTRLTAPFDGYVQKLYYKASETVAAGMPVLSLIAADGVRVEVNLSVGDYLLRDKFEKCHCTAPHYPGVHFPMELIGITQKANLNQLYLASFDLKDAAGVIPVAGMSVQVSIDYRQDGGNFAVVPLTALFDMEGNTAVWVVEDGKVHARQVTPLAFRRDGSVVVNEGLHGGENVVSAGVHVLKDGDAVRILPPSSESNIGHLI